jgi:membrane protease YdiL (CAAX protease family)
MQIQENLVSDKPPLQSILTTIAIFVIGFMVVGGLLGFMIAAPFYEGNLLEAIQSEETDSNLFYPLLIIQGVTSFVGLIVFPFLQIRFLEHKNIAPFFPKQPHLLYVALVIAVLAINFMIALSPIAEWNASFDFPEFMNGFEQWARSSEDRNEQITKTLTAFTSAGDLLLALLVVAILPGIGEEIVFRGLMQNEIFRATKNPHVAIWVAAFIFSAIHFQFFGFVPRLLLGAMFGYLYYWSGNLWVPILAHFFNNGIQIVALYYVNNGALEMDVEAETAAPWPAVLGGSVVTTLLLFFLWRLFKQQRATLPSV